MSGKGVCKEALLDLFGLPPGHLAKPVIGIVSRFADQKGFDLIAETAHQLMREELLLVVLGTGERKYEELFRALAPLNNRAIAARRVRVISTLVLPRTARRGPCRAAVQGHVRSKRIVACRTGAAKGDFDVLFVASGTSERRQQNSAAS